MLTPHGLSIHFMSLYPRLKHDLTPLRVFVRGCRWTPGRSTHPPAPGGRPAHEATTTHDPCIKGLMKIPRRMKSLVEEGLVDEVLGQLKSGKEAQIYVVRCGDAIRCAKVYKEAHQRSFKQAVQYQEGRKVRNSRRTRAMAQRTRYGQKEQEAAWLHAEVDALYQLAAAGVRVPAPWGFMEGVLLME